MERPGLDMARLTRMLDNYGVRHTIEQHGNAVKTSRRAQIAVTLENLRVGLITLQSDSLLADRKNKIYRDVLVFVQVIYGIGHRHVEEI